MSDVTKDISTPETPLVFTSIANEESRSYYFPTGVVTIVGPLELNVKRKSEGDSHRIKAADGISYYVPAGWLMLSWKPKPVEAGGNGRKFDF